MRSRPSFLRMRKIFEDRVLPRGERNRLRRAGNRASAGVDEHSTQFDLRPRLANRATDQRPKSSQEFGQIKWFDEIIVRSVVEAANAVLGSVASSEHQQGSLLLFAQSL